MFMGVFMIRKYLYRSFIELTNKRWTSFLLRRFVRSRMSYPLIKSFVKVFNINMTESERPIHEFSTLHDLFVRTLHKDARIIENSDYNSVVSPVDAVIAEDGIVADDVTLTVKGKQYSIEEMLGNKEKAKQYTGGHYIVFYLSPAHYHRIHSPVTGKVMNRWDLGRHSYPVNAIGLHLGKQPLAKNYRSISEIQTEIGMVAMVKVGAMFVNTIEYTHQGSEVEAGDELAYFAFGSTVILLFEKGVFNKVPTNTLNVKMGEYLGTLR